MKNFIIAFLVMTAAVFAYPVGGAYVPDLKNAKVIGLITEEDIKLYSKGYDCYLEVQDDGSLHVAKDCSVNISFETFAIEVGVCIGNSEGDVAPTFICATQKETLQDDVCTNCCVGLAAHFKNTGILSCILTGPAVFSIYNVELPLNKK
jgi:hypothetical protein